VRLAALQPNQSISALCSQSTVAATCGPLGNGRKLKGMAHDVRVVATLSPWLLVRNSVQAVEFYKAAFGAIEKYRLEGHGGVVSRLAVGNSEFWVSDESPEHGNFSPQTLNGISARMILTVADPDAVFAQACQAGARAVHPVQEGHGWRVGRIEDPCGHHWEIGRQLNV
jgi:PhnB protein